MKLMKRPTKGINTKGDQHQNDYCNFQAIEHAVNGIISDLAGMFSDFTSRHAVEDDELDAQLAHQFGALLSELKGSFHTLDSVGPLMFDRVPSRKGWFQKPKKLGM